LHLSGVSSIKTESFDDTLSDLSNYSIIALAQRLTYPDAVSKEQLGDVFNEFVEKALNKRKENEQHVD
jgi:hypothetical protein